jgi:hypothetical protein
MNRPFLLILAAIEVTVIAFAFTVGAAWFTPLTVTIGTVFLSGITMATYLMAIRVVQDENPNRFVRTMMLGTMLKFFAAVLGAGFLIFLKGKALHKPDLYLLMGLYLVLTLMEAGFLSQAARRKKPESGVNS